MAKEVNKIEEFNLFDTKAREDIKKLSSQYKDIANFSLAKGTDGKLYIKKQDGTLIGDGIEISGSDVDLSKITMSMSGQTLKLLNDGTQIATVEIPTTTLTDEQATTAINSYLTKNPITVKNVQDINIKKWKGKKIVIDGSSITHGSGANALPTWGEYLKQIFDLGEVYNHAKNGTGWFFSGDSLLINRVDDYESDADAVILMGDYNGIYMMSKTSSISDAIATSDTISSSESSSYHGKLKYLAEKLIEKYPLSPIIWVVEPPRNIEGQKPMDYNSVYALQGKAIEEVAEYYGFQHCNLMKNTVFRPWITENYNSTTSDGTHPWTNIQGTMAQIIAETMKATPIIYGGSYKQQDSNTTESGGSSGGSTEKQYTITYNLSNATSSNSSTKINVGSAYTTTISANNGYTLSSVTCTMGDKTVSTSNGNINILSVTGDIVITATTTKNPESYNIADIATVETGYAFTKSGKKTLEGYTLYTLENIVQTGDVINIISNWNSTTASNHYILATDDEGTNTSLASSIINWNNNNYSYGTGTWTADKSYNNIYITTFDSSYQKGIDAGAKFTLERQ